jgi:ferritin-like metal-binding protein YciE
MSELNTIEDLLIQCVKDLYSAETQLVEALPQMAAAASEPALADAFTSHLEETKGHVLRLEQVADLLSTSPHGATCVGMQGLIAEGSEILRAEGDASVKDLALAGAARKVEHFEIASYCGAKELAEALGNQEVVGLLQTTEDEEKSSDKVLTAVAAKVVGSAPSAINQLS